MSNTSHWKSPFKCNLSFGKRKKSDRARSGEHGEVIDTHYLILSQITRDNVRRELWCTVIQQRPRSRTRRIHQHKYWWSLYRRSRGCSNTCSALSFRSRHLLGHQRGSSGTYQTHRVFRYLATKSKFQNVLHGRFQNGFLNLLASVIETNTFCKSYTYYIYSINIAIWRPNRNLKKYQ